MIGRSGGELVSPSLPPDRRQCTEPLRPQLTGLVHGMEARAILGRPCEFRLDMHHADNDADDDVDAEKGSRKTALFYDYRFTRIRHALPCL